MHNFIAFAVATLLIAAAPAYAQPAPAKPAAALDGAPVFAGLSDAEVARRVQAVIDELKTRPEFVGLSVAVARGDHMIVDRGEGIADLEWNQPADARSPFRIGSLTKQFTAAAIMKLKEQGKLRLDDSVSKYLPDFDTEGHTVTLRQLLNHTSGIPNYTAQPGFMAKQSGLELSEQDVLKSIAGVPFDFAPGSKWAYSNTNYFLLGMIIEKITGRSYADYMESEFFKPLHLAYTRYGWEAPIVPERAQGYAFDPATGRRTNAPALGMSVPGGAGGLISTAGDLVRWQIALTNGRAVSPASFQQMITSTVKMGQGDAGYGFGLMVDSAGGHRRIWHNGGINGFNSVLSWWPDTGLRIAVISNCEGLESNDVEDRIVAALTSSEPQSALRSTAQPGAEAALRHLIEGVASGKPDYAALTPQMADVIRTQLASVQAVFRKLGAIKSITFKDVGLSGADDYVVQFANGAALFTISLDAQGKIQGTRFVPIPPANAPAK